MRRPRLHLVGSELAAELAEVGYESLTPDNAARLRRLADDGSFIAPPEPSYVVYELASGEHRQTGVVVEVAVDDYRHGRIQAHEGTDPTRIERLGTVLDTTRLELVPLTLTHDPCPELRAALATASAGEPDVRISSERVDQAAWIVRDADLAGEIARALPKTSTLYIADGHHRIAAAERYAAAHPGNGELPSDFVLGALFPWDEVRILGYHRCAARPEGRSTADLVEAFRRQPAVESLEECDSAEAAAPAPGRIAMHLDGRWYQLRLRPPPDSAGPRESLDLAILESAVLGPALEIADPAGDSRVLPVPGTVDPAALTARCAERNEIGFLLYPPTTDQVRAVSDAGQLMPAKATWFDPKARTGPFFRDLS
ncbi:MAG: DUF1015 family protein [Nocardioidaceae bacterium]